MPKTFEKLQFTRLIAELSAGSASPSCTVSPMTSCTPGYLRTGNSESPPTSEASVA